MKEGTRYVLERPPDVEELNPQDNYVEEFDKWAIFKAGIEAIGSEYGLLPNEAILNDDIYQLALDLVDDDRQADVLA